MTTSTGAALGAEDTGATTTLGRTLAFAGRRSSWSKWRPSAEGIRCRRWYRRASVQASTPPIGPLATLALAPALAPAGDPAGDPVAEAAGGRTHKAGPSLLWPGSTTFCTSRRLIWLAGTGPAGGRDVRAG